MTDHSQYYDRATSWAESEQTSRLRQAGWSRMIAIALAAIAALEALALILLVPLKTTAMVPVLVDRQTGFVEVLKPGGTQELTANQALVQSLLAQYVTARESFNVSSLASAYHSVALWSAGAARADYVSLMPASNPASPLRLYPRSTIVETTVKSISMIGPQTALVRFETRRVDGDAPAGPPQAWASVIAYRFSSQALTVADRWLNPLGFQVVSYHRDAESLSESASVVAAASKP